MVLGKHRIHKIIILDVLMHLHVQNTMNLKNPFLVTLWG